MDVLDTIKFCQEQINYWQAQQVRALAEYGRLTEGDEFAEEEIAPLMGWTSNWAFNRLELAKGLVGRLPATMESLERGEIDLYKATVLKDLTEPLTDEQAREVEARVLPKAVKQTGAQTRQYTRRVVMRVDPKGVAERAAARKADREAGMIREDNDMAKLYAFLPADRALAIAHRVDKIARKAKSPDDTRTMNQRRADVVADLLLATPDGSSAVKVHVYATMSVTMLMGLDDLPGELAGYGPISADLCRELASDATWHRLLTDPKSGVLLDFGRNTYRPPASLRDFIWARDKTCRQPGCMMAAQRCEIDHTKPFPAGKTSDCNCGAYCKRHHRMKHESDWVMTQPLPGRFVSKSPTGKVYVREPEPVLIGLPDDPPF